MKEQRSAPSAPPLTPIADAARTAIRSYLKTGTVQKLADAADVNHQLVSRFLDGAGLSLASLDRLAGPLNLVLHQIQGAPPPRRGRRRD